MSKMKIILPIVFLISALFLFGLVSATTLVTPDNGATVSGTTYQLNATNSTLPRMINCTFYAKSPSTATTSWTLIGSVTNITQAPSLNLTFNSTTFEDSNDYSFNASCANNSNTRQDSVNTGITIDNTVPVVPILTLATNTLVTTAGAQTFTSTVNDAKTTGCTYKIGRGGTSAGDAVSGTATYSATSCSFTKTFTDVNDNGNWYWTITASDGTTTATSTPNILQAQFVPIGGGGIPNAQGGIDIPGTTVPNTNIIWILIAIGVIIFLIVKFNKRR